MEAILKAIGTLLGALAPSVAEALTGGQTPEEALDAAKAAQAKLPNRENDGEWDKDLGDRIDKLPEDEHPDDDTETDLR